MEIDAKTTELYNRFLNNQATAQELEQLLDFFRDGAEPEILILIQNALDKIEEDHIDAARANHLANLSATIMSKIDDEAVVGIYAKPSITVRIQQSTFLKIAASIVLVAAITLLTYFYFGRNQDVKPGGNFATLINSQGEKIDLSKDEPRTSDCCVKISKTADGRIIYQATEEMADVTYATNTIVTPMGGRYKITLSDGSLVILNSGSSLTFPVGFNGPERKVKLSGEGYFEITKNPQQPFVVEAGSNTVQVLGTKFNISSYADDQVWSTYLLEGKIKFKDSKTQYTQILAPGEQLSQEHGRMKLDTLDAGQATAWKDGKFVFENEELASIMHKISRWYNVEVDYSTLPQHRLYAKVSMDANLSEVLNMISLTSNLNFKIEGRRIVLKE